MNNKIQIIILAAGKGNRMQSELPKALVKVGGKPMIRWILEAIEKSGVDARPTIIVGHQRELILGELGDTYEYIVQEEQLGTGHAVRNAEKILKNQTDNLMVLPSDHPFISSETIKNLAETHLKSGVKITMATAKLPNFEDFREAFYKSFSRIVRDKKGNIVKDVQFKDATEEEKKITEINPIYFCFECSWLWEKIKTLSRNNAQKEYYLTDLVKIAMQEGRAIESISINPIEALAANSKKELEILEKFAV